MLDVHGVISEAGQRSLVFDATPAPSMGTSDVRALTRSVSSVARWIRPGAAGREVQIVGVHDWMRRQEPGFFDYARHIADLSIQQRLPMDRRHDIVWGGGMRYRRDDAASEGPTLSIDERLFGETMFNTFAQDQVTLAKTVRITLGAKVEHTNVIGWSVQPTARLWWSPDGRTALWSAVSRALRNPSRSDTSLRANLGVREDISPLPAVLALTGNGDAGEERLLAYEAGVRTTFGNRVALDVSGFLNRYDDLLVPRLLDPVLESVDGHPHLLLASVPTNVLTADTAGFEAVAVATLAPRWQLTGTAEVFRLARWRSSLAGVTPASIDSATPQFQWSLRSSYSTGRYDADVKLIAAAELAQAHLAGYTRVDGRISRRMAAGWDLALAGQNLLDSRHREAPAGQLVAVTPVRRSATLSVVRRF